LKYWNQLRGVTAQCSDIKKLDIFPPPKFQIHNLGLRKTFSHRIRKILKNLDQSKVKVPKFPHITLQKNYVRIGSTKSFNKSRSILLKFFGVPRIKVISKVPLYMKVIYKVHKLL
jgi:hypothetical protein